jgi:dihydrolipoamide dehydrogenase
MGSVWNRLGSEVTVVEFAPDIVPSMDAEVRKQFQRMLEKQKFKFMLKTKVVGCDTSGDGVKLTLEPAAGGDQTILEADVVLVSAGRTPFTSGIGLETIGVETDKAGRILVDKRFMTNVKGVYAIGDAIPGPMLAHKAEEDGVACVEFIAGKEGHVDYDTVPGVVYTHPEVASVGKTEEQVKALGIAYRVGKFPLLANSRAKAIDDAEGLVKVVAEKETDKILGVHIMAPNAGEIIHEAVLALQYGASSEDVARTCHAHPTVSEALKEACLQTFSKAIHI